MPTTNLARDTQRTDRIVPIASGTSGANASVAITLAAVPMCRHHLIAVQWSYSAAPTGGNLLTTGLEGDEIDLDIAAAGPGGLTAVYVGLKGGAVTVTLAAGGGALVGKLVVSYMTVPS
jgi:hypothetical protein